MLSSFAKTTAATAVYKLAAASCFCHSWTLNSSVVFRSHLEQSLLTLEPPASLYAPEADWGWNPCKIKTDWKLYLIEVGWMSDISEIWDAIQGYYCFMHSSCIRTESTTSVWSLLTHPGTRRALRTRPQSPGHRTVFLLGRLFLQRCAWPPSRSSRRLPLLPATHLPTRGRIINIRMIQVSHSEIFVIKKHSDHVPMYEDRGKYL